MSGGDFDLRDVRPDIRTSQPRGCLSSIIKGIGRMVLTAALITLGYFLHDVRFPGLPESVIDGGDVDLKVKIASGFLSGFVQITNTGQGPITINNVQINGRDSCIKDVPGSFPKQLQEGDSVYVLPVCNVVRVSIATNRGAENYKME